MAKYLLKDGREIENQPIGKSSVIIGEINESGYLEVVGRGPNSGSSRGATVICKCRCGNYTLLKLNAFRNGSTKSCGCYNIEKHKELCKEIGKQSHFKDYTKIENDFYIFLYPTEKFAEDGSKIWKIKCKKCGKEYEEVPSFLISDKRNRGNNPCSCYHRISKGAIKIENILKNNCINYEKEKMFDTCLSPKQNKLRFDFYLPDFNLLIEYDGEQHTNPINFGSRFDTGEERLKNQKEYDNIKNNWCKENNIELIRISYKDYEKISLEMILGGNNG